MLMLKAEQAAIKTVSPLEQSWRDCLLLTEIPPGACSHFLSFTSLSSFPGFFPPSALSLSLLRSLLVGACEYLFSLVIYPLTLLFFFHPVFLKKNPIALSAFIHLSVFSLYVSFSLCLFHSALLQLSGNITSVAQWPGC